MILGHRTTLTGVFLTVAASAGLTTVALAPSQTAAEPNKVASAPSPNASAEYDSKIVPLMRQYCYDCHGERRQRAGLDLEYYETLDAAKVDREVWANVREYVHVKQMPPPDKPQPSKEERALLTEWIERNLLRVDCGQPVSPGRVTLRRLNRVEYENTIRDLFGLSIKLAEDFPTDDVGYGFDNIGDVLSMPPLLLEKYLAAAEKVVDQVIVIPEGTRLSKQYFRPQNLRVEPRAARERTHLAFSTNGSGRIRFTFPVEGEYVFRMKAWGTWGGGKPPRMELDIDKKLIKAFDVEETKREGKTYEVRQRVSAGARDVGVAFTNDFYNPQEKDPRQRDRNLYVYGLEIEGPFDPKPKPLPEHHRNLIIATPNETLSEDAAARQVLEAFVSKAYRRPVQSAEIDRLMRLVALARENDEPYEGQIRLAVRAVLCSPHFLFRVELDPDDPDGVRTINDFEFTTRLSYFLWSSMPDAELFELAKSGKIREPAVLKAQLTRMLKDPKSSSLVDNFVGQWLQLRNLDLADPDDQAFPEWDDDLRNAMRRETELFVDRIIREDRHVLEILDADWTFVNERLAKHYGIPNISGAEFRPVTLTDRRRGGVLTQASVLTLTSDPTRTAPVKRGKWVLETLLGTPPPPPPPDVEELSDEPDAVATGTLRQRLEKHRESAICASCHQRMDPIGFGLENFDPVGRWRDQDGKFEIDSSGELPDGGAFRGPAELREVLKTKAGLFRRCLTEKLLTYGLGRGLEFYDQCAVDTIVEQTQKDGDRFSALVWAIVTSDPFQKRAGKRRD